MMTYDEQLQYYSDLLIIQYRGKAKAQATIQVLGAEALCDNIALQIQDAFDLETAIGVQLDVVGKYANVQRNVLTFTGGVTLNDSDFRTLIKLALADNSCKGSLKDIEDLLFQYFGNSILIFDNADMTLSYFFNAAIGSLDLLEAFVNLDLLPRPTGVALSSLIYAVGLDNYFAFSSYYVPWPSGVSGFNSYYDGTTAFTGTTHIGTMVIDGIADTSILTVGDAIGGLGVGPGTFIASIDSGTQITTTKNSLANHTGATLFMQALGPWIDYDNVISF